VLVDALTPSKNIDVAVHAFVEVACQTSDSVGPSTNSSTQTNGGAQEEVAVQTPGCGDWFAMTFGNTEAGMQTDIVSIDLKAPLLDCDTQTDAVASEVPGAQDGVKNEALESKVVPEIPCSKVVPVPQEAQNIDFKLFDEELCGGQDFPAVRSLTAGKSAPLLDCDTQTDAIASEVPGAQDVVKNQNLESKVVPESLCSKVGNRFTRRVRKTVLFEDPIEDTDRHGVGSSSGLESHSPVLSKRVESPSLARPSKYDPHLENIYDRWDRSFTAAVGAGDGHFIQTGYDLVPLEVVDILFAYTTEEGELDWGYCGPTQWLENLVARLLRDRKVESFIFDLDVLIDASCRGIGSQMLARLLAPQLRRAILLHNEMELCAVSSRELERWKKKWGFTDDDMKYR